MVIKDDYRMDYADGIKNVLLRKIHKAEQDLLQLKLDYCRFVYGLSHRSRVQAHGREYQVNSVDVASMTRQPDGSFSRPEVIGVPVGPTDTGEAVQIGCNWTLIGNRASSS
ncbi:hypothetical protein SAMN04487960_103410 [Marinobacter mobilis]|uniref:Uncharacterized protein n=2 Tax=Marinobacter mobilis TaxID=488533 RepID=A0A1H2VD09_9GAMM|nr:hypothetical protein SAMN04487960_103410 [Marinobacter mobilis]